MLTQLVSVVGVSLNGLANHDRSANRADGGSIIRSIEGQGALLGQQIGLRTSKLIRSILKAECSEKPNSPDKVKRLPSCSTT